MGTGQVTAPMHPIHKMAQINNSQLSKELIDGAKIQTSAEQIPTQLAEKVVPVMEVNPKMLRIANIALSGNMVNGTSTTILTTRTDTDFFLSSVQCGYIKDATSTSIMIGVTAVINGALTYLIRLPSISITIGQDSVAIGFPLPLKIDRGTAINVVSSTNVANISVGATITGYYDY